MWFYNRDKLPSGRWDFVSSEEINEIQSMSGAWADGGAEHPMRNAAYRFEYGVVAHMLVTGITQEEEDFFWANIMTTCDGCGRWFTHDELEEDWDRGEAFCWQCNEGRVEDEYDGVEDWWRS